MERTPGWNLGTDNECILETEPEVSQVRQLDPGAGKVGGRCEEGRKGMEEGRLVPTKADFWHIIESGGGRGSTVEVKNR